MSSESRRAVVTGSSSGIGRSVATRLLADGWRVRGLDIAAATLSHPAFEPVVIDLRDGAAVEAAAADAGQRPLDALVHAAGVLRTGPLGGQAAQDGELMWRLHVDCVSRMANCLVPGMARQRHGRVVLVGSRVARGMAGRSQYAASKAALVSLARSWGAEVASQGVTVNVVSPAATRTGMLEDPARAATAPRLPPIGRLIEPDEVAALVAYLLSPQAAAITGQDIQLCGGASLEA